MGLVSQLPQFGQLGLADWDRFVVGGHEIRRAPLVDEVLRMARESRHAALPGVVEQCRAELEEIDGRIRPGTILGVGATIAALADADVPPRRNAPPGHRPAGPRHGRVRPRREARPPGGGQRGLDRAAGGCVESAANLGGIGAAD